MKNKGKEIKEKKKRKEKKEKDTLLLNSISATKSFFSQVTEHLSETS